MLATMFFNQVNTAKQLQGSNRSVNSLSKMILQSIAVMLFVVVSFTAKAQKLTATYAPSIVCEGGSAVLMVGAPLLPAGVTVTAYVYHHPGASIGDSTVSTTPKQVPVIYAPGVYHPYVVAHLSAGADLSSDPLDITVYFKPRPEFVTITQDTQCFKNNNVCFQNLTNRAPSPSAPVVQYVWEYGDAFYDSVTTTTIVCHKYGFTGTFSVTLRAIDSVGCRADFFIPADTPVVIKPNLKPEMKWKMRKGPCFISNYLFTNLSTVNVDSLQSFTYLFGDDSSYTASAPFDPIQRAYFDSIGHDYTINGEFSPTLILTDKTGCSDTTRYTANLPKNIRFDFDVVTTKTATDFAQRDSVCLGSANNASICFKQTPISFASPGTGDFTWNFDDPPSQQDNIDITHWNPCHTFVKGIGTYYVTLTIRNVCPDPIKFTYYAGATLKDDKYIDKIIYANNDTTDAVSRPRAARDTIITPKIKFPLRKLVYTGNYIMSGHTALGQDTFYVYQALLDKVLSAKNSLGLDSFYKKTVRVERPYYYISNDTLLFKGIGLVRDTITWSTNFKSITPVVPPVVPAQYDTFAGYDYYGYGVRVLGPFARIEDPNTPVTVSASQKNQCGPSDTVDFVNTAQYYKSRKMYRRWDFDDNFAPQCTSYSIPQVGYPPYLAEATNPFGLAIRYLDSVTYDNGKTWVKYNSAKVNVGYERDTIRMWVDAIQQYTYSDHYFIANKQVYGGKMNCKFSYDSLPRHHYPNWDSVYRMYSTGHDFMPWDPSTYGSGAGLIPINPADSMWWGKPVFLNPTTGAWSLTQGTGPAPYGLWVRIDTIKFNYNNGQDLRLGEPINVTNLPDPFRPSLVNSKGEYPVISGASVEPNNTISYKWLGKTYTINGSDLLPGSNMTFYKYAFLRTISRCVTVKLNLQDSFNNESTQGINLDSLKFDTADCKMEATLQLALAKADGHGLGKRGKECPGLNPNLVTFSLGAIGNFPGVVPSCGQTFILFNFDSLADRLDNTPCDLDAFVTWTGDTKTPTPGLPSTTPGGLVIQPFNNSTNFNGQTVWQSGSGTSFTYHYGLGTNGQSNPPADTVQGFVTVGLVIGSGCKDSTKTHILLTAYQNNQTFYQAPFNVKLTYNNGSTPVPGADDTIRYTFNKVKNYRAELRPGPGAIMDTFVDIEYTDCKWAKCLSDTVWYHNFLKINNLAATFDVEPVNCRLRHKGEEITVHYQDSVQDDVKYSVWDWGDNTITVDSFYYADSLADFNNGYFINGVRRVRYNWDAFYGTPQIIDSTVWPIRAPGGPYVYHYYDSSLYTWVLTSTLSPISLSSTSTPPGAFNGEYRITNDNNVPSLPVATVIRWDSLGNKWAKQVSIKGTTLKQTEGLQAGVLTHTVLATNFYRIFNIISRTAIPGKIIVKHKCPPFKQDTLLNSDTMQYFPPSQVIDTALMFLPIKHIFKRTSWEVARKVPGSATGDIRHLIVSTRGCTQPAARPVTIGIVDTFDILNSDGDKDTLFCENEPVYFVDSLRYFRYDCQVTELPFVPAQSKSAAYFGVLDPPYDNLQIDSADFWRQDVGDPRPIQNIVPYAPYQGRVIIDTVVAERVYWDFGDGSPIDSSMRPMHKYTTFGRYKVTMLSKDSLGKFDTCYGYLNVSQPAAKIGFLKDGAGFPKTVFNCGDFADLIDSSTMKMGPDSIRSKIDSVKTNYWWFGDNKLDTVNWQAFNNFFPKHPYRTNGSFRVKLVSESYLGCKDTTYDTVFVKGPRPMFRLLNAGDTLGCAPFKVRIVNMADSLGKYVDANGNTNPSDTPTLSTFFVWGDKNNSQTISDKRRDTIEFIYDDSGDFAIYSIGSDAAIGGTNQCALVVYPDTPNQAAIHIHVKKLSREVTADKQVVCKDGVVTISNNSDTAYKSYSYVVLRDAIVKDSVYKAQVAPYTFAQTFLDTGYYNVIATPQSLGAGFSAALAGGCKIPDTLNVRVVYPMPVFVFDTLATGGMPKVKCVNTSDTMINNKYDWTVTKVGAATPKFTYSGNNNDRDFNFDLEDDTGTFNVCLKAYAKGIPSSEACATDTCLKIRNTFNISVEIPNVFSPNGDGANDEFKIKIEGEQKYKLTIYNRWGGKVFESGEAKTMWNGKIDNTGAESPAGVYYYIFDYQLRTKDEATRTGTITLIR